MNLPSRDRLPSYDELPVVDGAPKGSSWGLWGPDDKFGCLNLLTPEAALAGVALAREGKVFSLALELELPFPALFGREPPEHVVKNLGTIGHDDLIVQWNTQSSTQWDGFRHISHPAWGYYNGVPDEEHGIHHWARRGLVGRAVLADVARWRESIGRPLVLDQPDPISIADIEGTLEAQGTTVEVGDVLLIRTGWLSWYRTLDVDGREARGGFSAGSCGMKRGVESARGLWNLHISAVAMDNPGFEIQPMAPRTDSDQAAWRDDPESAAENMLHFALLGLLGLPIGELFDLDALAEDCAADGRYEGLITSAPLNLQNGVASPPNALVIK
jgi:hypothetical protein